jgi:hypothetical protein
LWLGGGLGRGGCYGVFFFFFRRGRGRDGDGEGEGGRGGRRWVGEKAGAEKRCKGEARWMGLGLVQMRAEMEVVGTSCPFCRYLELRSGSTRFESF